MMGKTHYAFGALFTAVAAGPTAGIFGVNLSPGELAIGVAIGTFAGVLPDIDHPNSLITKGLVPGTKYLGKLGKPLGWFFSIPPRVIGIGARATMNHRGGTHSATFMMMWTLLAAPLYALMIGLMAFALSFVLGILSPLVFEPIFNHPLGFNPKTVIDWLIHGLPPIMPLVMISVFWGYFAHLFSDSMTKVPVPWPWPFSKKRFFLLPKGMRVTTDSSLETGIIRPIVMVMATAAIAINVIIPLGNEVFDRGKTEVQNIQER